MSPEINTIEEARAEILRLNEELTNVQSERDNYSNRINELSADLENVRTLNQQMFLKLTAQNTEKDEDEDDEPAVLSCEDFAKTLTI